MTEPTPPLTLDVITGRIRMHYLPGMEGKTFGAWMTQRLETPEARAALSANIAQLEIIMAAKVGAGVVSYAAAVPPAPLKGPTEQFYVRVTDLAFGEEGSVRGWLPFSCPLLARNLTVHPFT